MPEIKGIFITLLLTLLFGVILLVMVKLVRWSKKMPKGAYLFLALFPLVSLFPIPPQEIKNLERIKQERIKQEDENGDTNEDDLPEND